VKRESALALSEKFNKTMNSRSEEMKAARDYGIGFPLYHSEVHLLDVVNLHGNENERELAERLGVTKGAVAQVAKKLLDKKLIESYQKPGNRKEIYFRLTDTGQKAAEGHAQHHARMNVGLFAYIDGLDEKDVAVIMKFLDVMQKGISEI
jgi:DNA-binding MarR family transcriptional regulator